MYIRILRAKFHCNRLTIVQDIQDYASLILGTHGWGGKLSRQGKSPGEYA